MWVPLKYQNKLKRKNFFYEKDLDHLQDRPPVLIVMGHVDHEKVIISNSYWFKLFDFLKRLFYLFCC